MKLLKDRHELAMAMNFGKYPVLKIDLADSDDYGLKGCRIRIDMGTFSDGSPFIEGATLRAYRDTKTLTVSSDPCCLSDSFGYNDYLNTVERAQAPLIHANEEVVVAVYDSRTNTAFYPFIVKTTPHVTRHCCTPIGFVDADMTLYLELAGYKD